MTKIYHARWVLPVSSPPIADGAIAVSGQQIVSVGTRSALLTQFTEATTFDLGESAIISAWLTPILISN